MGLKAGTNTYAYVGGKPLTAFDPSGLLSAAEAFMHYLGGSGTPLDMQLSEIDTSPVRPSQFPKVKAELEKGCQQRRMRIDDRKPFTASGDAFFTVGNITLRLKGTFIVECDCSWRFEGALKAFDDHYDFNPSTHRSWFGEFTTFVGSQFPGAEYDIHINGARPITERGHL